MPQFNIHWKGCPHRHLPSIRVSSGHYRNINGLSNAHSAAENVVKLPFGLPLEKARQQQRSRTNPQRRRSRELPGIQNARKNSYERTKQQRLNAPKYLRRKPIDIDHRDNTRSVTCMSGALKGTDTNCPRADYKRKKTLSGKVGIRLRQDGKKPQPHRPGLLPSLERPHTYDLRLPVKRVCRLVKSNSSIRYISAHLRQQAILSKQSSRTTLQLQQTCHPRALQSTSKHSAGSSDQVAWLPSRTPSQLKALKTFIRELEQYIVAQKAISKAGLSSASTTSSSLSACTVAEFMPYADQFKAADLSITSQEQRMGFPKKFASIKPLLGLHIKDTEQREGPQRIIVGLDVRDSHNLNEPSYQYNSSSYTSTASTGATVIAFASMDGPPTPKAAQTAKPTQVAARKTLPWLRKVQDEPSRSQLASTNELEPTTQLSDLANLLPTKDSQNERKDLGIFGKKITLPTTSASNGSFIALVPVRSPDAKRSVKLRNDLVLQDIMTTAKASIAKSVPLVETEGCPANITPLNSRSPPTVAQYKPSTLGDRPDENITVTRSNTVPRNIAFGVSSSKPTSFLGATSPTASAIGSFRHTASLLEKQKLSYVDDQVQDAEWGRTEQHSTESKPTSRSPTRLLPSPSLLDRSTKSKMGPVLKTNHISGQYDYSNPSIFEKALLEVKLRAQELEQESSQKFDNIELPAPFPRRRYDGDPAKRQPHTFCNTPEAVLEGSGTTNGSLSSYVVTCQSNTTISTGLLATRDRDVFKGLQIAMAAAYDDDIDAWITETSGCQVRRFLANLNAFEGLGVNALVEEAMRTAKMRRKRMQAYRRREDGQYPCQGRPNIHQEEQGKTWSTERDDGRVAKMQILAAEKDKWAKRDMLVNEFVGRRNTSARRAFRRRAETMGGTERGGWGA